MDYFNKSEIKFKTKVALTGLIITLIFGVVAIRGIVELFERNDLNVILGLFFYSFIVIVIYFIALSPAKIYIFYEDKFFIKSPFVSIFISDKEFKYSEIQFARFTNQSKGPQSFVIGFVNGERFKCGYYSRFFSGDKKKIAEILNDKGIEFHVRDYNKIKKYGEDEWVKIPEEYK